MEYYNATLRGNAPVLQNSITPFFFILYFLSKVFPSTDHMQLPQHRHLLDFSKFICSNPVEIHP